MGITRLDHGDADGRVRDGIEIQPTLLVGEGQCSQRGAVDGAVVGDDPGPELVDQRLVGRSAGSHHVPCHLVSVDEDRPTRHEEVCHGGLSRADASRQPDGQHQVVAGVETPERALCAGSTRRGFRATAKRSGVESSTSSVTNQSSAVMPVTPPTSSLASIL